MSADFLDDTQGLLAIFLGVIGIGGAVFAAISHQARRIREDAKAKITTANDIETLSQKIEAQDERVNKEFEHINRKFEDTDERFDKLEETIALNTKAIENSVKQAVREGNQDIVNAINGLARSQNKI